MAKVHFPLRRAITFRREPRRGSWSAWRRMELTRKILRLEVYWPVIYKDASKLTEKCPECQDFAPFQNQTAMPLNIINDPWPFHQWVIDIVGLFPTAPGGAKFLLVAIDYFTKWIEFEPLTTVSWRQIIKFMWKNIIARFGTLRILISDNGTQFDGRLFKEWCEEKKIHHRFTSVVYP